jgi:archaellum component FlaC
VPRGDKEHPSYKSVLSNIEEAKARLQVHEEKVEELEKEIEKVKAAETSEVSRELFTALIVP